MIKKLTLTMLTFAILVLPALPAVGFAYNPTFVENGQLKNNRVLIPLRAVSHNMGAAVEWNQHLKTIKIRQNDVEILLTVNSKKVTVNHTEIELDVPVELINNSTYVPLRFVSQALGAEVEWNQQIQQATIILKEKRIVVNMGGVQLSASRMVSDDRIKLLSDKLNEVGNTSAIKDFRRHFKPYFTDRFINTLIEKGIESDLQFGDPNYSYDYVSSVYYKSSTTARLLETMTQGIDLAGATFYVNDRIANLVYSAGVWKVDSISFPGLRRPPVPGWEQE
ncbi:copper amine oxidase N-terminal domain-containing protein [Paenibacillaceae bacterium]|nr:copper amine oxidase N-terminal domain-containing protein [Paenibacillaceae bacterium]